MATDTAVSMESMIAAQPSNFLDLPLDIRMQIYEEYFVDQCHPPAKTVHEEPLSTVRLHWQPALLTVNKQITDEISDLFRRQTTFTYRISWQESWFDNFSMCCFRASGQLQQRVRCMKHFRVEIYPPHRDRPTDMVHIWNEAEAVCNMIGPFWKPQHYWRPEHLSIVFMENEVASWSHNGKRRESMVLYRYGSDEARFSDISYILDIFESLNNIPRVTIQLPNSLACNENLQDYRQGIEERMMAPPDDDSISMMQAKVDLERSIEEAEPRLKEATGKISRAKIEAICEYGLRKVSPEELHRLKQIWPHTDTLPDSIYFPDHKYTGVEPTKSSLNSPTSFPVLGEAPTDDAFEQEKALLRSIENPNWYRSKKMRHQVLDVLWAMRHRDSWFWRSG